MLPRPHHPSPSGGSTLAASTTASSSSRSASTSSFPTAQHHPAQRSRSDAAEGSDMARLGDKSWVPDGPMTIPGSPIARSGFSSSVQVQRGMFAGKNMRFSLEMAQGPIHGRRKTEKDRRPLAHCPILRLRLLEQVKSQSSDELIDEEPDLTEIEPSHLVCAAELCAPPTMPTSSSPPASRRPDPDPPPQPHVHDRPFLPPSPPKRSPQSSSTPIIAPPRPNPFRPSPSPSELSRLMSPAPGFSFPPASQPPPPTAARHSLSPLLNTSPRRPPSPPSPFRFFPSDSQDYPMRIQDHPPNSPLPPSYPSSHSYLEATGPGPPSDIASERGEHNIEDPHKAEAEAPPPHLRGGARSRPGSSGAEGEGGSPSNSSRASKKAKLPEGRNLYGNLHVAGVRVPDPEGVLGLWFLFTDLTVRHEGTYTIRFRCFDITATEPPSDQPIPPLVECISQQFQVYSPRNFPGLPKPTELAEHFAKLGFKLNTRKNERSGRVSPPPFSTPPTRSTPSSARARPPSSDSPNPSRASALAYPTHSDAIPDRPGPLPVQKSEDSVTGTSSSSGGSHASSRGSGRGLGGSAELRPLNRSFGEPR